MGRQREGREWGGSVRGGNGEAASGEGMGRQPEGKAKAALWEGKGR